MADVRSIDANRLKEHLKDHYQSTDQEYEVDRQWAVGYNAGIDRALFSIDYAPTINPDDLRSHGWWENVTGGMVMLGDCSECRERQPVVGTNYCKKCGACMEENHFRAPTKMVDGKEQI